MQREIVKAAQERDGAHGNEWRVAALGEYMRCERRTRTVEHIMLWTLFAGIVVWPRSNSRGLLTTKAIAVGGERKWAAVSVRGSQSARHTAPANDST